MDPSMRIGIIGQQTFLADHRSMIDSIGTSRPDLAADVIEIEWPACWNADTGYPEDFIKGIDAVLISVPPEYLFQVTQHALRSGLHAYISWSPSLSIPEIEALSCLAEEAGAELGIDLSIGFHPVFECLPETRAASIVSIRHHLENTDPGYFLRATEEAIEISYHFSASGEIRRIDAQMVRGASSIPEVLLAGIRFQNNTYAHIYISTSASTHEYTIQASGTGFNLEVDMNNGILRKARDTERLYPEENADSASAFEVTTLPPIDLHSIALTAFIEAIATGKPAPASILDGLQTRRIIEKLRHCLR